MTDSTANTDSTVRSDVGAPPVPIPLGTRSRAYGSLITVVTALLFVGLLLPIVVGERRPADSLTATGPDPLDLDGLDVGGTGADGGATDPDGGDGSDGDLGTGTETDGTDGSGGSDGAPTTVDPNGSGTATTVASGTGDGSGGSSSVPRTASDIGVTADTIKLGLLLPTADGIGSTADQRAVQQMQVEAFVADLNDRGGIHGRRVELAIASYDVLDQETGARAACLRLADDEQVFAVVNTTGFAPPGTLCLTREKGVPFLQGSGHPEEVYAQSNGLYSSTFDNQTRNFRNLVATLHRLGALDGKRVGVLATEWLGFRRQQEDGIVRTLRSLGYEPDVYWLSGDPVSSQSQIPVALLQLRDNDVVILGADFLSGQSFVQLGAAQGFRPRYAAADPWGYTTDQIAASMGAAFNGAISSTSMRTYDHRAGVAEPELDARCRQVVAEQTDLNPDRTNDPDAVYTASMLACGVIQRFERAALAAGPNLTRARFAAAVAGLGTVAVPFAGGPATYGPQKLDGANHYRAQQFQTGCNCWQPAAAGFSEGEY